MLSPVDIRLNLREWVECRMGLSPTDVLIDELGFVNRAKDKAPDYTYRADLALANGRLVGFEIKSGADTLKRWPDQSQAYLRVFDEVWLCTHGKHLEKAMAITPKQAGVMLVDDYGSLAVVREAKRSNSVDAYDLSGLLWKEELIELCDINQIETKSRETKADLRLKVSSILGLDSIRQHVLEKLKIRKHS
ncbi:sce7726 family protein [Pseudomonas aestusnigri]|uniref:sce7726 family protein n=1 Tax=Halopseudomonas aestusnigri TaxID=857252 RepID=UPI001D1972E2|nr:sce7726 family protein [Halopseudomonas aestusnigri]MCC4261113.1 sce7726 family protein [Halopseudomonas aestusnigri]